MAFGWSQLKQILWWYYIHSGISFAGKSSPMYWYSIIGPQNRSINITSYRIQECYATILPPSIWLTSVEGNTILLKLLIYTNGTEGFHDLRFIKHQG